MTKSKLEQLISLREEIKELEHDIAELEKQSGIQLTDKVQASLVDFPYTRTMVTIQGYDKEKGADRRKSKRLHRKAALKRTRKAQCEEIELEITEYINEVPDSELRRIIEYRYIKGYTWEKIGQIFHVDRTTVEKRISKYIESYNEDNG